MSHPQWPSHDPNPLILAGFFSLLIADWIVAEDIIMKQRIVVLGSLAARLEAAWFHPKKRERVLIFP